MIYWNQIVMAGAFVTDPKTGHTARGVAYCTWRMAYNRHYRGKQETVYIDCHVYGSAGTVISRQCAKGTNIFIVGRLEHQRWTDTDGMPRQRYTIAVEQFRIIPKPTRATKTTDNDNAQTDEVPDYGDCAPPF